MKYIYRIILFLQIVCQPWDEVDGELVIINPSLAWKIACDIWD
jgi:hypothetical protein